MKTAIPFDTGVILGRIPEVIIRQTVKRRIQRTQQIFTALAKESRGVNASTLATRHKLSTKTIQREIKWLRDALNLQITYDAITNTYHLKMRDTATAPSTPSK